MRGVGIVATCLLVSTFGSPLSPIAWGQTAATSSDPVVVTARARPKKAVVERWIGAISGYPPSDTPLSRVTEDVCIAVSGLRRELAVPLADRVLTNAERLKIRLGGDKCRPNVLILFVDHGAEQIGWLADHRPGLFGNLPYAAIRAMKQDKGPVHAWHMTAIASRDGDRPFLGDGGIPMLNIPTSSRIDLPIQSQIAAAVVMIDRSALPGKTVDQLADYATLRALAVVRPRHADGITTILSLFEGERAPESLTPFDWGYLRGLYSGRPTQSPMVQYAAMARFMDEEMTPGVPKP